MTRTPNPGQHRQHAAMPPQAQRRATGHLRWTIAAIVMLVAALGVAQHIDSKSQAEEDAMTDMLIQRMQEQRAERLWAQQVANAYARGRAEALHPDPSTPEHAFLVTACSALGQLPYRQP